MRRIASIVPPRLSLCCRPLLVGTRIGFLTRRFGGKPLVDGARCSLACGVAWRHLSIEGFDRLVGKGIVYGAARNEAPNMHGLDVHIVGAGNSVGQASLFFSNHAKSVTILCRGESLEKSMPRYFFEQLSTRPNIRLAPEDGGGRGIR
jgi:thioredoxin reductase (NADPH)